MFGSGANGQLLTKNSCRLNNFYCMVRRTYSSLCFSVLNVSFSLTLNFNVKLYVMCKMAC